MLNCVETLITVNVFPDGAYHMKFHSEGDKKDIFDQDFPLPNNCLLYTSDAADE